MKVLLIVVKEKNKMTFNVSYKKSKKSWIVFGIIMTDVDEIGCTWVLKNGNLIDKKEEDKFIKEYKEDLENHCNEIYRKYYKL